MSIFKRYRIKNIFFVSFFLLMLIVFIMVIIISYHFSVREIVQKTTDHQEKNLKLISEDIDGNLSSLQDYTIVMSRQQAFRDALKSFANNYERSTTFSTLTKDFSNIIYSVPVPHSVEIFIEDPPRDNLYYPVRYQELDYVISEPWFSDLEKVNSIWLDERKVNTIAGEQEVVSLGRKIVSPRGSLQAVLIVNIDPVIVEGWLRNYKEDANVVLMLNHNDVITKIGDQAFQENFPIELLGKYSRQLTQQDVSNLKIIRQGQEYVVVSYQIPSVDWVLMEVTPLTELTSGLKDMINYLILIGITAIIIAFIGTFYLTRKFTEPIIFLARMMGTKELSKSKKHIPGDYTNEFGELFKGYKKLINRAEILYMSLIKQMKRQKEAEVKALQANINPHFLYNTLDQLNWMAIERDNHDMSQMLELLGKMLRVGLSKGESIFTVEQELQYLYYYLQIQKLQYGDALQYSIDAPATVSKYYIPKLTFQPFVENAIIHGLHNQHSGVISVELNETDKYVICKISDNGVGLTSEAFTSSKMNTGGYGIRNVRERLDVYFGTEASVTIGERAEGGVVVTIKLPKIMDKELLDQFLLESF
ncbi:sensor histidine kinase [Gracilibacillus sp. D59]|uniref:sensor histidine kinase n=1 Tax=Gracilibacillus sp. D59 TaxID=3457434 RepID=UPI003FCCA055